MATQNHIDRLRQYLNTGVEKANEDLACNYFRLAFNDSVFKRQNDAFGADGYFQGHFIVEIKGNNQDWYPGLFQALAYKRHLDFSMIVVVSKGFLGVWNIEDLPEYIYLDA